MSQPKRYGTTEHEWLGDIFTEKSDGDYVLHSDYAALAAEKEALVQQGIRDHQDWRSKLNFLEADYKAEVARLTAENERLRKAGDESAQAAYSWRELYQMLKARWEAAAKEGGRK